MTRQARDPRSVRKLQAYQAALALVGAAAKLLPLLKRFDSSLESQMKRAVVSIPLNLAEALRRTGRDRAHLLTVALGSASEVQAIIDVGMALEVISEKQAKPAWDLADRVSAMVYKLRQSRA